MEKGGGMCGKGGHAWQRGGVHGKGGACMARGACVVCMPPQIRPVNVRRYATYWNAFLFVNFFEEPTK